MHITVSSFQCSRSNKLIINTPYALSALLALLLILMVLDTPMDAVALSEALPFLVCTVFDKQVCLGKI